AVQLGDGAIGFRISAHLDEAKTLGAPCVAIRHDADAVDGPIGFKHAPDRTFGGVEAEISYKNVFHLFPLVFLVDESGQDRRRAVNTELMRKCRNTDAPTIPRNALFHVLNQPVATVTVHEFSG